MVYCWEILDIYMQKDERVYRVNELVMFLLDFVSMLFFSCSGRVSFCYVMCAPNIFFPSINNYDGTFVHVSCRKYSFGIPFKEKETMKQELKSLLFEDLSSFMESLPPDFIAILRVE